MIPAKWRRRYGVAANSEVILSDEGDKLTLETRKQALRRVQQWARTLAGPGRQVVKEFLAERRQAARREALED